MGKPGKHLLSVTAKIDGLIKKALVKKKNGVLQAT